MFEEDSEGEELEQSEGEEFEQIVLSAEEQQRLQEYAKKCYRRRDHIAVVYRLGEYTNYLRREFNGIFRELRRINDNIETLRDQISNAPPEEQQNLIANLERLYAEKRSLLLTPEIAEFFYPAPNRANHVYTPRQHSLRENCDWLLEVIRQGKAVCIISPPLLESFYRANDPNTISAFGREIIGLMTFGTYTANFTTDLAGNHLLYLDPPAQVIAKPVRDYLEQRFVEPDFGAAEAKATVFTLLNTLFANEIEIYTQNLAALGQLNLRLAELDPAFPHHQEEARQITINIFTQLHTLSLYVIELERLTSELSSPLHHLLRASCLERWGADIVESMRANVLVNEFSRHLHTESLRRKFPCEPGVNHKLSAILFSIEGYILGKVVKFIKQQPNQAQHEHYLMDRLNLAPKPQILPAGNSQPAPTPPQLQGRRGR